MSTLAPADFDVICQVVRREAAIVLEPGKEYLAENRLHPVVRKLGFADFQSLVGKLRAGDPSVTGEVVDALTTNETSFFRDGHPWDTLRDVVLPDLFERRAGQRSLNVWFAAASSGQEPFSFALLLKEHFPEQVDTWRLRLIGTDISPSMLERCQTGRYSQLEANRGLPARMLVDHFSREGMAFVIEPEIRSMFEFRTLNLAATETWGWLPTFDLVFIRNVLIYFDVDTKTRILEGVERKLADGGTVLLGGAESTMNLTDVLTPVRLGESTMYRRSSGTPTEGTLR